LEKEVLGKQSKSNAPGQKKSVQEQNNQVALIIKDTNQGRETLNFDYGTFQGSTIESVPNGEGRMDYKDGSKYEGIFVHLFNSKNLAQW
jgi:hypothetical protein